MKDFSAPALHVAESSPAGREFGDGDVDWARRKFFHNLLDDADRLKEFLTADDETALHVTFSEYRDRELHLVIESVWEIAAQIVIEPGGAACNTDDAKIAGDSGIPTAIRSIDRTELYVADEVFLCGTGAQISPVTSIDHRTIGKGEVGAITAKVARTYFDAVHGRAPEYRSWVLPVYKR